MKFLELSSEGDKQLAYANTTALRTVATEKCLWLKDRRVTRACIWPSRPRQACVPAKAACVFENDLRDVLGSARQEGAGIRTASSGEGQGSLQRAPCIPFRTGATG